MEILNPTDPYISLHNCIFLHNLYIYIYPVRRILFFENGISAARRVRVPNPWAPPAGCKAQGLGFR